MNTIREEKRPVAVLSFHCCAAGKGGSGQPDRFFIFFAA
ncbi:hypothetical protein SD78_2743 [Bacillus badius]|nr:hypothetical protein SD78_2743 [Bacillus badius]